VRAGHDLDGGIILAGRAYHEGDLIPAKVTPSHGCAFVAYGGKEHAKTDYEVLLLSIIYSMKKVNCSTFKFYVVLPLFA
jgi:hypothetical protein